MATYAMEEDALHGMVSSYYKIQRRWNIIFKGKNEGNCLIPIEGKIWESSAAYIQTSLRQLVYKCTRYILSKKICKKILKSKVKDISRLSKIILLLMIRNTRKSFKRKLYFASGATRLQYWWKSRVLTDMNANYAIAVLWGGKDGYRKLSL